MLVLWTAVLSSPSRADAAPRVTEVSKIRARGSYGRSLSGYRLEGGERVRGDVYKVEGCALYARSLGRHFALGGVVTGRADEFENLRGPVHGGPPRRAQIWTARSSIP